MAEQERVRVREQEPEPENIYEIDIRAWREFADRQKNGKLVVHASDREWAQTRQGRIKHYLHDFLFHDIALNHWKVFMNHVHVHSGKHRHQGGHVAIFVLEGKGWTVIDGERHDWKAGDLMLLPLKPGGVEHQHFSADPDKDCRWIAFLYEPFIQLVGAEVIPTNVVSATYQSGR